MPSGRATRAHLAIAWSLVVLGIVRWIRVDPR
jgi:hypothetical protein